MTIAYSFCGKAWLSPRPAHSVGNIRLSRRDLSYVHGDAKRLVSKL